MACDKHIAGQGLVIQFPGQPETNYLIAVVDV